MIFHVYRESASWRKVVRNVDGCGRIRKPLWLKWLWGCQQQHSQYKTCCAAASEHTNVHKINLRWSSATTSDPCCQHRERHWGSHAPSVSWSPDDSRNVETRPSEVAGESCPHSRKQKTESGLKKKKNIAACICTAFRISAPQVLSRRMQCMTPLETAHPETITPPEKS